MKQYPALLLLATLCVAPGSVFAAMPSLHRQGDATQLVLDGKPFLMLGGELHNSSSGTSEQADSILPKLALAHVNTVLTPVSWELIEPTEGSFDFSVIDHWVAEARLTHVHLVLLWFGSWKNGASSYVPGWVKKDSRRFPRAVGGEGREMEVLSTLSPNNRDADANAFRALMRHIKQTDSGQKTVLMVQVENEVGVFTSTRDRSAAADRAFEGAVPDALLTDLKQHPERISPELAKAWTGSAGTWSSAFGGEAAASEIFMAWNYGSYIGQVVAAGKQEYGLPMYVNAQLPAPHERPGEYPSGGPHPYYLEVWRAAAPAIDFFAPDVYWNDFDHWCERYRANGNPLFVPEARNDVGPYWAFYAFGEARAFGFSPFAIDDVPAAASKPDEAAKSPLVGAYGVLEKLAGILPQAQAEGRTRAIFISVTSPRPSQAVALGGFLFQASLARAYPSNAIEQDNGAMLVLQQADGEFLIAGSALRISVSNDPEKATAPAGIASVEEGTLEDGLWKTVTRPNGDEDNQGHTLFLPAHRFVLLRVKLYQLPH
jgi:hypothetical protein